jgi:hypothetical protein
MAIPAEKAWAAFKTHQRECGACYDLKEFQKLPPVATDGSSLPAELCKRGRALLDLWLADSTGLPRGG